MGANKKEVEAANIVNKILLNSDMNTMIIQQKNDFMINLHKAWGEADLEIEQKFYDAWMGLRILSDNIKIWVDDFDDF